MKHLTLSIVVVLASCAAAMAGNLKIEYSHAGLTMVQVTNQRQLHFAWHTGRLPFEEGDSSPMRQSLEAYDSHSTVIWLTRSELEAFETWIQTHGILKLKAEYPEPAQKTYGSAFHSSLAVELDGKKHSLTWNGDTKVPDSLHEAVNKLVELSHRIRKAREGR